MRRLNAWLLILGVAILAFAALPTAAFATRVSNSAKVSNTIPAKMLAGGTYVVQIRMKNTGKQTWTYSAGYKLKALGDDPYTKVLSYKMSKADHIKPGHTKTFFITMKASEVLGRHYSDWRMCRGNTPFGATVGKRVTNLAATLMSIQVTTPPAKLHYLTGESLDLSGLVVTGSFNSGMKKALAIGPSNVSGFDSHAVVAGQVLTITVGGKTATFTVDIAEKKPVAPTFSADGATSDGTAISGTLAGGFTLPTTNDSNVSHSLAFVNPAFSEPVKDAVTPLFLKPADAQQTADLVAYYASKPDPWKTYLDEAAAGTKPFAYLKSDGTLLDAAVHDLGSADVAMRVPDTFVLGTYTVAGTISDAAGNTSTVTLKLIVTGP